MDKIDNNIIPKILTFRKYEPIYALISSKNEIWRIGNIIDMLVLKKRYNNPHLIMIKEHKPFNVIKIDKKNSFIIEANH